MAKPSEVHSFTPDAQYTAEMDAFVADLKATSPSGVVFFPNGFGGIIPPPFRERLDAIRDGLAKRTGQDEPRPVLHVKPGDAVTINGHRFLVTSINERNGTITTSRRDDRSGSTAIPCDGEGLYPDPVELGPPPLVPALAIADTSDRIRASMRQHELELGDRA